MECIQIKERVVRKKLKADLLLTKGAKNEEVNEKQEQAVEQTVEQTVEQEQAVEQTEKEFTLDDINFDNDERAFIK